MSKNIQEALLDLKARQEAGEKMPCPRCGRDTMKPDLHTNALSRHADGIYVCDDCGTAEAMLDFMRNPLPLECWAQFREGEATADFKAVPGEEALKTIKAEPNNSTYLYTYAWILYLQGRYEEARIYIDMAVKNLNPDEDNTTITDHQKSIYLKLGEPLPGKTEGKE